MTYYRFVVLCSRTQPALSQFQNLKILEYYIVSRILKLLGRERVGREAKMENKKGVMSRPVRLLSFSPQEPTHLWLRYLTGIISTYPRATTTISASAMLSYIAQGWYARTICSIMHTPSRSLWKALLLVLVCVKTPFLIDASFGRLTLGRYGCS